MKRLLRASLILVLVAANMALGAHELSATPEKGNCDVYAGVCEFPCDAYHHFCICTTNSACQI